jgi:hypothetical protein
MSVLLTIPSDTDTLKGPNAYDHLVAVSLALSNTRQSSWFETKTTQAPQGGKVSTEAERSRIDNERWRQLFAASKSTLEEMYDEAMAEYLAGDTIDIG